MTPEVTSKRSESAKRRCTSEWRAAVSARQMGHGVSDETRKKISLGNKGKKISEGARRKMSISRIGHPVSEETREKIRRAHIGMKRSQESREKQSKSLRGRYITQEHKDHIAKAMTGSKNHQWKGGVSTWNHKMRTCKAFENWREEVFKRDDYTCQDCGKRGCYLHPHHILGLAEHPEFMYDVDNGITLCVPCHRARHGWKVKFINNKDNE